VVVVCVALTAAFAPGFAAAKPGYFVLDPGPELSISLSGSHGYRVSIENIGQRVLLTASKGDVTATYAVRGKVSAAGIEASFGNLGQISVGFHRSAPPSKFPDVLPIKCKGKPAIREVGSFDGRIRFHGEMGFTALSVQHAKGALARKFKRVCKWPAWLSPHGGKKPDHPDGKDSISATTLAAASNAGGRITAFEFGNLEVHETPKHPAISLALARVELREHHGGVRIFRSALIGGNAGSLLTSAAGVTPATATVTLPSPFTGTASYSKTPGSEPSWTGSLQVELPGAGKVPLTGPRFTAALCEGTEIEALRRCLRPVLAKAPDSYGAGSARAQ